VRVLAAVTGAQITSSFIGTDAGGTAALANGADGVSIQGSAVTVGGPAVADGNVISGNVADGIHVSGGGASQETIEGNLIGTDVTGTAALGNGGDGVGFSAAAGGSVVSGAADGEQRIWFNGGAGISDSGNGDLFDRAGAQANSISANTGGGIVVGPNAPVVGLGLSPDRQAVSVPFTGATPNATDVRATAYEDPATSCPAQGAVPLQSAVAAANGSGEGTVTIRLSTPLPWGDGLSVLLTDEGPPNPAAGSSAFQCLEQVINTNDSGPGSLRQAILDTNAGIGGAQIDFAIALAGSTQTIDPNGPLPVITRPATLDATTQATDPTAPLIVLDGSNAGPGAIGLEAVVPVTLAGFDVRDFGGTGVFLAPGSDGSTVATNELGTDATGESAAPNAVGITVDSDGNTIGAGPAGGEGNVISGNLGAGILVEGDGNEIGGNLIGPSTDGATGLGNAGAGVVLEGAGNVVGGAIPDERNAISGNGGDGVLISGAGASADEVAGNLIGIAGNGTGPLGNAGDGVRITGASGPTTVAGSLPDAPQLIAFNGGLGIDDAGDGDDLAPDSIFANLAGGIAVGPAVEQGGPVGLSADRRTVTVPFTLASPSVTVPVAPARPPAPARPGTPARPARRARPARAGRARRPARCPSTCAGAEPSTSSRERSASPRPPRSRAVREASGSAFFADGACSPPARGGSRSAAATP
jgi:hypothetical protein